MKLAAVHPVFAGFDSSLQQALEQPAMRCYQAGDFVYRRGDQLNEILVVIEGCIVSFFERDWGEQRVLSRIQVADLVGAIEILHGEACRSDFRALEDTQVFALPAELFEVMLQKSQAFHQYVQELTRPKIWRLLVARFLNDLFSITRLKIADPLIRLRAQEDWLNFEKEILGYIEFNIEWQTLQRGDVLFRQGDRPHDGAYILVSGKMTVSHVDGNGNERLLAVVSQGEMVGELALITDQVRTGTLHAVRDCELFRIKPSIFDTVTEKYPRIMLNVFRTISSRLTSSQLGAGVNAGCANIALLPASPGIAVSAFGEQLIEAMQDYTDVGFFTASKVDALMKRPVTAQSEDDAISNMRLVQWLNSQENFFNHIVYAAEDIWSAWTRRCVRQSDHVVLVIDEGSDRLPSELLAHVKANRQQWSLLVLHAGAIDRPRNTARLLKGDAIPDYVMHVRQGNEKDMHRTARILSGCATGLVLGGGGARGFAHLGVLRALEELDIEIDMVGGTSIGAPIAAWVAQGKSAAECLQAATDSFRRLIDFTLPTTSLISGKRISQVIQQHTADWHIEDFWLPYFCISTNITRACQVVHSQGDSARAIRASVSIPGVLPPVPDAGDFLVDGGVLNNMPIDVMRQKINSGKVIAIDVSTSGGLTCEHDYGTHVSGWSRLLQRFVPWLEKKRPPGLAEVLMETLFVGSAINRENALRQGQADFYMNIELPQVGLLNFSEIARVEKAGYSKCYAALSEWKAAYQNASCPAQNKSGLP